jgi:hypothetical protein
MRAECAASQRRCDGPILGEDCGGRADVAIRCYDPRARVPRGIERGSQSHDVGWHPWRLAAAKSARCVKFVAKNRVNAMGMRDNRAGTAPQITQEASTYFHSPISEMFRPCASRAQLTHRVM